MNGSTATTEYIYDANGNLTKDLNKGISSITYNSLNLPQVITFTDGSTITYTYTADGTKLRVVHVISGTTTQTDYCGNVIYESGAQKYLLNEVGYYNLSTSGYFYYLKDHQGNNRVVINSSGTVQETNHYYPFGGLFASSTTQPFKYNGKEFDNKKGLNWYDYGARHYDVALGRWHTVDPLTDKYYGNSPYTYCVNSPLLLIDPDGESPKLIKLVYNVAKGTYKTYRKTGTINLKQAAKGEILGFVDDVNTLFDDEASTADKILAGFNLLTGFGEEAKGLSKALGIIDDVSDTQKRTREIDFNVVKSESDVKSINQLQKEVEKGQAPKGIKRFDKAHDLETGQPHVHFKDSKNSALNKDGSWKEGQYDLNKKEKDYLKKHGWKIEE